MNHLQTKTTKKSTLKLEEFNECPGAAQFRSEIKQLGLSGIEFVDSQRDYYQNAGDTAVFTVPQNAELLKLTALVHNCYPDEFNYYFDNHLQAFVVRLWWD